MATTSPADEEFTIFGRRWRNESWWVPVCTWVIVAAVAALVHKLQEFGQLPTGGRWFFGGCVIVTAVLALAGLALGAGQGMTRGVGRWCAGTPAAGGAWVIYTTAVGIKSGPVPWIAWLVLGALVAGSYKTMRDVQRRYEMADLLGELDEARKDAMRDYAARIAEHQSPKPDANAVQWEEWTDRAGLPGMIFRGRYPLRGGAGLLLHFELPDSADVSYQRVVGAADKLELLLMKEPRLRSLFERGVVRPGCVRVAPATDADERPVVGEVFITVDLKDILAQVLRMPTGPDDYTPMSIMEAFCVGQFVDGTPIYLTLHEIHVLIIGQTQNGKSNLLHVLIRQLARCTDVVLWGLDFKGGDTLRLWMNPYMQGMIDPSTGKPLAKCIFDWIAVDNHIEAERIMLAALEAAKRRPAIVGGGGWVPSPKRPAIVFIADEISEIVGTGAGTAGGRGKWHVSSEILSGYLTRLFKLGTGQGIYGVTAGQRGTVGNVGSGDAKSQQKGRIILPVTGGGDVADVLQGSAPEVKRLAASLEHPGSVVIEGWAAASGKAGKIWLVGTKPEIQARVTHEVLQLTRLRHDVELDADTAKFIRQYGYDGRPGGPNPDPDRIAWYYGRDPQNRLVTWDYDQAHDQPVRGSNSTIVVTQRQPQTTAERLGLDKVRSPFADLRKDTPKPEAAAPAPRPPIPAAVVDEEWARMEAALLEEMDAVAQHVADTPEQNPATGDQAPVASLASPAAAAGIAPKPTKENCAPEMIRIIHAFGPQGGTAADVYRELEKIHGDNIPHRATIYPWLGWLVKHTAHNNADDQVVTRIHDLFFTRANVPAPRPH